MSATKMENALNYTPEFAATEIKALAELLSCLAEPHESGQVFYVPAEFAHRIASRLDAHCQAKAVAKRAGST
jgi:hypothetical protein